MYGVHSWTLLTPSQFTNTWQSQRIAKAFVVLCSPTSNHLGLWEQVYLHLPCGRHRNSWPGWSWRRWLASASTRSGGRVWLLWRRRRHVRRARRRGEQLGGYRRHLLVRSGWTRRGQQWDAHDRDHLPRGLVSALLRSRKAGLLDMVEEEAASRCREHNRMHIK